MERRFEIKEFIYNAIEEIGFKDFSEIQQKVIPNALKYKSIVAKSQTGTGKTHAYLIPILNNIDFSLNETQAVIVSPTKELAMQIVNVANQILAKSEDKLNLRLYTGGNDRKKEVSELNEGFVPQLVIATPGKLHDLVVKEKCLKVHKVKTLVIDEADMCLDDGFIDEVDFIASSMQENLQIMTFSATMTQELDIFLKKYMGNPIFIGVEDKSLTNLNIEHSLIKTKYKDKYNLLKELVDLSMPYLCLIFTNTKESCIKLYDMMKDDDYNVCCLHGDLNPRVRKQVLRKINDLEYTYVVCTDIAARGIDIADVSHVINYELPSDVEFYVHRSGRTARFGKTGVSISFYEYDNYDYLDKLESLGLKFTFKQIKNGELVDAKGRNERNVRVKQIKNEKLKQAKKQVSVSKKVKPGYKKKYQEELKEKMKEQQKRNRRGRR